MKKKIISLVLAFTAMTAMAGAEDYTLRPGDQLNIIVTQDTDISSSTQNASNSPYLVRPDGKVSFPLVGEIDTNGMMVSDLITCADLQFMDRNTLVILYKQTVKVIRLINSLISSLKRKTQSSVQENKYVYRKHEELVTEEDLVEWEMCITSKP